MIAGIEIPLTAATVASASPGPQTAQVPQAAGDWAGENDWGLLRVMSRVEYSTRRHNWQIRAPASQQYR